MPAILNDTFAKIGSLLTLNIVDLSGFVLSVACSIIIGLILAAAYMIKNRYTKSFLLTIAILPAVVCVVIMTVNGNIGAGIAVMGAFSLVRFRSVPGTAKEIVMLFSAMGAGLLTGMGSLPIAVIFAVTVAVIFVIYNCLNIGKKSVQKYKSLRITIPEDLDYTEIFDDIFAQYTTSCELIKVKSTNMGSMFRLTYNITEKDPKKEKEMIDLIRTRNGNLEITVSKQETTQNEL